MDYAVKEMKILQVIRGLSHEQLKMEQNIRGTKKEHIERIKQLLGYIITALKRECKKNRLDFIKCIEVTWAKVSKRDWNVNKVDGVIT
jgi:hypothetical protein